MKKFLLIATMVFIVMMSYISDIVTKKIVLNENEYFTKSIDDDIYIAKNSKWEKLHIVGVNLDGSKPGRYQSDNAVTEKEYLRWIKQIDNMGANCIRVSNLMSENFYNAIKKFNENKSNPIYVMQGIYFDETYLKDGYDPQSVKLESIFKTNIKLIIDSIHGNPFNIDKPDILQNYDMDISDYVIGYTLGIEFAKNDIIYTEIMNEKKSYKGEYLYTDENASSFESYLARMGDYLASYELKTYKNQRIIGIVGSSDYEIVDNIDNNEGKDMDRIKDYIELENIRVRRKFKPGIFAAYNIYPSFSETKQYDNNIQQYLEKLEVYHDIPVVINEIGIPSSRSGGDFNKSYGKNSKITEKEQGESLIKIYKSLESAQLAGSFIFQYQDSWNNSSWNTRKNKILDRSIYWSDAQTYSQQFGIMTYEPGKEDEIVYPDENIKEWNDNDKLKEDNNYILYCKNDEKYLYMMIKAKSNINIMNKKLYIDLDITPKSGSKKSKEHNLKFENPVDFIININDKEDARILVHEYYNNFNFNKDKKDNMKRPDLISKTKDMDEFSKIYMQTRPKMYVKVMGGFEEQQITETGRLVHGNGNPKSNKFNSISDYYIGKNHIEIRIPWAILNFMDPSTKQIQDDFYELLEVRPLLINDIKIGLSIKEDDKVATRLGSSTYELEEWIIPTYHERLKQSYYILKKELTDD